MDPLLLAPFDQFLISVVWMHLYLQFQMQVILTAIMSQHFLSSKQTGSATASYPHAAFLLACRAVHSGVISCHADG